MTRAKESPNQSHPINNQFWRQEFNQLPHFKRLYRIIIMNFYGAIKFGAKKRALYFCVLYHL